MAQVIAAPSRKAAVRESTSPILGQKKPRKDSAFRLLFQELRTWCGFSSQAAGGRISWRKSARDNSQKFNVVCQVLFSFHEPLGRPTNQARPHTRFGCDQSFAHSY